MSRTPTAKRCWPLPLVLTALVFFVPATGFAQDSGEQRPTAEITEDQIELNEEGVRAIVDGDYSKAVALLNESLLYGEANVTYLNLGRAYQKKGDCKKAREALQKVKSAPVVDKPPPEIITKQAQKYLEELEETCPSDREAPAGETGEKSDGENSDEAEPAEAEEPEEEAVGTNTSSPTDQDTTRERVERKEQTPAADDSGGNVAGWTSLGIGAALGAGAATLHFLAVQERSAPLSANTQSGPDGTVIEYDDRAADEAEETANMYDSIALGTGIAGAVLIGVGTYLLLTDSGHERATLGVTFGEDGAAALLKWRF